MNREEIEEMFDKQDFTETSGLYEDRETYTDMNAVKSFFFDTILPEVLREITGDFIDESKTSPSLENSFERWAVFWHNEKLRKMQMEAKEKYNITL